MTEPEIYIGACTITFLVGFLMGMWLDNSYKKLLTRRTIMIEAHRIHQLGERIGGDWFKKNLSQQAVKALMPFQDDHDLDLTISMEEGIDTINHQDTLFWGGICRGWSDAQMDAQKENAQND